MATATAPTTAATDWSRVKLTSAQVKAIVAWVNRGSTGPIAGIPSNLTPTQGGQLLENPQVLEALLKNSTVGNTITQSTSPAINKAATATENAIPGFSTVAQLIGLITSPSTWAGVAMVIAGAVLVFMALHGATAR
jgi:hypothetical protein